MRIYIAGGSTERLTVVRPMIERVKAAGHTITHDWTQDPGYDLDRPLTKEERRDTTERDVNGVDKADVFWLMVPAQKSEGAAFELGYAQAWAHAYGKDVIVSGARASANLFTALADRVFWNHEEALVWVLS